VGHGEACDRPLRPSVPTSGRSQGRSVPPFRDYEKAMACSRVYAPGRPLTTTARLLSHRLSLVGLVITLPAWADTVPFLDRFWPPQPCSSDVPVRLRHLMAGHVCADRRSRVKDQVRLGSAWFGSECSHDCHEQSVFLLFVFRQLIERH
jgi:hypothetical protein